MSFDTKRFIVEIQNRPCLWDTARNDYSDRNLKIRCWDEIVNLFKEKEEMTLQEIKQLGESLQKRWKSIRGCYTRELNRQKSVKSGSGCGSRKSEYIYFKQLQFLQKVVAIREPDPAAAPPNPEDASQKDRQVDGRKRQKTKENTEDDKFISVLNKSIESREKSDIIHQDEDRLFLLSLVETLKRVPPHRKMATKIKIMSVLDEETRTVPTENTRNSWSQPPNLPTRSYGYSTGRGGSEIGYNAESSTSSHELPSRSYSHEYSTRGGQSEIPYMDYAESPNAPTTISEDSSILDIYD